MCPIQEIQAIVLQLYLTDDSSYDCYATVGSAAISPKSSTENKRFFDLQNFWIEVINGWPLENPQVQRTI